MKLKRFLTAVCLFTLTLGSNAYVLADVDQAAIVSQLVKEVAEMKQTIRQQQQKINELEIKGPSVERTGSTNTSVEAPPPMTDKEYEDRLNVALGGADKWLKDLKFSGDLRLRYEGMNFTSGNPAGTQPRNRFRFRLRYGFEKKFSDDLKVGFGLTTAQQAAGLNNDPISMNQTFTNDFNYKNIFIDKAYATYTPTFAKVGPITKLEVTAGKFNNPFELGSSDMVFDRDLRPEGIYEKANIAIIDTDKFNLSTYLLAGQFVLQENAALGRDANLFAYQGGINAVTYTPLFERPVNFLEAVSYYDYDNFARRGNFLIGATSLANGNPNVVQPGVELDNSGFRILESYSEIALYPMGLPTRFYFDIARNDYDNANSPSIMHETLAYAFGARFGQLTKKKDWELLYQYKWIGANSVVGAFTDSDFGLGGTGKAGNVFRLSYQLTDNITLSTTAFFVENLNSGTAGVIDEQQRRFQLDIIWKF